MTIVLIGLVFFSVSMGYHSLLLGLPFECVQFVIPMIMTAVFAFLITKNKEYQQQASKERDKRALTQAQVQSLKGKLQELKDKRITVLEQSYDKVYLIQTRAMVGGLGLELLEDIDRVLTAAASCWARLKVTSRPQLRETLSEEIDTRFSLVMQKFGEFNSLQGPTQESNSSEVDLIDFIQRVQTSMQGFFNHDQTFDVIWGDLHDVDEATPLWRPVLNDSMPTDDVKVFVKLGEPQMFHIVMTLIMNARDALKGRTGRVQFRINSDAGLVGLEVTDNGVGMSEETQGQLFEPFFSTKDEGKGSGLSLYLLGESVRRVDGEIMLESSVGIGTTITVRLPQTKAVGVG